MPYVEALSDAGDPTNPKAEYVYVAEGPTINHAVTAVERAREVWAKAHKDEPTHGHIWGVKRVDRKDIPELL